MYKSEIQKAYTEGTTDVRKLCVCVCARADRNACAGLPGCLKAAEKGLFGCLKLPHLPI